MKDVHSSECYKKLIYGFIFFELWPIAFTNYGDTVGVSCASPTKKKPSKVAKFTGKMRNVLKLMKKLFSDFLFEIWLILY